MLLTREIIYTIEKIYIISKTFWTISHEMSVIRICAYIVNSFCYKSRLQFLVPFTSKKVDLRASIYGNCEEFGDIVTYVYYQ